MRAFSGFKVILGFGLAISSMVFASDDHSHGKGPHGGEVTSFGSGYHLEGIRQGSKVVLYVLDGHGEKTASVPKAEGGNISVIAPGAAPQKTEIKAGDSFSEVTLNVPEKGNVTVLVSLKMGEKAQTAKFNFNN